MNSEMGFLSLLLKSLNPFNKLLLMPRVINRFPVFILCLSTAFLVSWLSRSQYEESLVSQRVLIPFKQYKYSYVHEEFGDANSSEIINCFFGKHQILKQYGCFRKICEKYSDPFVVYTNLLVAQGSVSAPPSSCAPTL